MERNVYKRCSVETMKHMSAIRFHAWVEFGMIFAQEFVTSRTMHGGGCGIINIVVHTGFANMHIGVGHLGVLDLSVG